MLYTVVKTVGVTALLCTSVHSAVLPFSHATPEVPWKRNGLFSGQEKRTDSCVNGPHTRNCWKNGFSVATDMDEKWPSALKTVKYDFDITTMTLSPDGVAKEMIVVNGQYPGPTIVADWGDIIEVNVKNGLALNGTGVHWHGLRQLGTNGMDGVDGVTECPIAPGENRTYIFQATQYGSSWYHSHYSVQYGDGMSGGIIINGPATANYDIDLGIYPFTDWFHGPVFTLNAAVLHAKGPPTADNLLVNGSMTSLSGGTYATTTLTPGKRHLLRLVNTGINNWVHVSLDGHPFKVIAADFIPIVPFTTNSLAIAVGQRYDVIIDANNTIENYWLRVGTGGGKCDGPNANAENIRAVFHYDSAPPTTPTYTASAATLPTGCYDETKIVPFVGTQVPQELPEEMTLSFFQSEATGNLVRWQVDGHAMMVDLENPTVQQIQRGVTTFKEEENVFVVGEKHQWQYWVIQQDSLTAPPIPHPIHLHGHDFYVLDQVANAKWAGDISRLSTNNPIRRDTATLPGGGYLVLAFESDNPGVWVMHCHIPFHLSAGLSVQFIERADEIFEHNGNFTGIGDTCHSWGSFMRQYYPNGITPGDSGL
ncbi:multicopper oxidase [Amniculicola lignicola CBS 123094]|uniref:Multicopper oxidase n=1 Tax=Amniculicola lignicola CBS 123094 TaxID=1392246 RepID=A0A6A5WC51_9PLEO|nr:multicopper oxidase [Amniculicola lignicola CBS 123094]